MFQLQLTENDADEEWNEYVLNKSTCSICLTTPDLEKATLTLCDHLFCRSCLDIWLKEHSTCPFCREHVCQYHLPGLSDSFVHKYCQQAICERFMTVA